MGRKEECARVEIEPAENGGFSVRKYYRNNPRKGEPSPYIEPKTYAFSTLEELSSFLHAAFSNNKEARVVASQG
ncbi:MAG TPA: hypothetical protein VEA16_15265 [Vicinamibacterales bacterium]|nr:hypothetical protein [Vicinamibacterales bacterium]